MTDKFVQELYKILRPIFQRDIKNETVSFVKRIPAEVIEADNNSHYADVRRLSDSTIMRLMNCSGKNLKTGDSVWVDYMYSMDNAYISIKNDGKPWGW